MAHEPSRRSFPVCSFLLVAGLSVAVLGTAPAVAQDVRSHVVRPGETLYRIAATYGITVPELKRINGLTSNTIRAGQRLVVSEAAPVVAPPRATLTPPPAVTEPPPPSVAAAEPDRAVDPGAAGVAPAVSRAAERPTMRPGPSGTLIEVAYRYGVPLDSLRRLNPDLPVTFDEEDELVLPASMAVRTYRVRRGDTLFRIATAHGTSVAALRAANGLERDQVNVGQVLRVPGGAASVPSAATARLEDGLPPVIDRGQASVYPGRFAGRLTSAGVPYDPGRFTVAHGSIPIGTVILVTNTANGRSALAEVNDRLPSLGDRILEVSASVAREIGLAERPVTVRIIDPAPEPR